MGKKLARTVVVDGEVYVAGSELPSDVEVNNPKAFEEPEMLTPLEQLEADQKADEERRKAAEEEQAQAEREAPKAAVSTAAADTAAKPAARARKS